MSTTMRIIILLLMTSTIIGNNFEGSIGLMGQFPKNEFKEQGVPTGLGIDFNGIFYPVNALGFGLNIGYGEYGKSSRQIPFNYFSDLITIEENTTNSIGHGHLFFKLTPFNQKWSVQPYLEGLIGVKHLSTNTTLYNNNCYDNPDTDHDDCEIASSTNASDFVFSYGWGVGVDVLLTKMNQELKKSGDLYFFVGGRFLYGGDAQYLKEGDIEFTDPADGPVTTTFNWTESATDLLQISFGLKVLF